MDSNTAREECRERLREMLVDHSVPCDQNVILIAETTLWENAVGAAKGKKGSVLQQYKRLGTNKEMIYRVIAHAQKCVQAGAIVAEPRVRTRSQSKRRDSKSNSTADKLAGDDEPPKSNNIALSVYFIIFVVVLCKKPLMKCWVHFNTISDSQQFSWAVFCLLTLGVYSWFVKYNRIVNTT